MSLSRLAYPFTSLPDEAHDFGGLTRHCRRGAERQGQGEGQSEPAGQGKQPLPAATCTQPRSIGTPWGPEAFERAKKENKLVFLSIGYSSCHWCHVMERESFSNAEIAKIMNENFVCIKVDREERPDIDDIYMTALSITNGQGGWPLTMFLTPGGKPIFGGTYFPPEDKKVGEDTMPGMKSVLATVIKFNKNEHDDLVKQADDVAEKTVEALGRNSRALALIRSSSRDLVNDAVEVFDIDPEFGGTGIKANKYKGTKFPRPPVWNFLLSQTKKPGKEQLAKLVSLTLHNIAEGGIYDHLGGGFHRYSTERTWTVPHFEKMLYDNAQLVELYSQAYKLNADPLYKRAAPGMVETAGIREARDDEPGRRVLFRARRRQQSPGRRVLCMDC